jgi:hypothetical protein
MNKKRAMKKILVFDGELSKIEEFFLDIFIETKKHCSEEEKWSLEKNYRIAINEATTFKELTVDFEKSVISKERLIFKSDFNLGEQISIIVSEEKNEKDFLVAISIRKIIVRKCNK